MSSERDADKPVYGHLRVARPTDHLNEILRFYRDGLGLDVLYEFTDHEGFDGVMLGPRVWAGILSSRASTATMRVARRRRTT